MTEQNKILIVDDDETVRRSYLRSLQSMSCNVAAARDGEEALQTMEQDPADVVLLDMRMPGQDGLSVLRTIKQKWPDSEVVIITGYPTVDSAKEAVRLGAYDYVAKPVGPQDVINITDGALTRKQWALRRVTDEPCGRRLRGLSNRDEPETANPTPASIQNGEGHDRIS